MGRRIYRVPVDFDYPSWVAQANASNDAHIQRCVDATDDDHSNCDGYVWTHKPPAGEAYQLWQTVSDEPMTLVFETAEALIGWCETYRPWGMTGGDVSALIRAGGWAPSGFSMDGRGAFGNNVAQFMLDAGAVNIVGEKT